MSFRQSLKWSFLSELASKAIPPIVAIILARLLTPQDYGVLAAAAMVISFSQIFWEAGLGKALIQHRGDREIAADVAFWVNNGLALAVSLLLVAGSGLIAQAVFHDGRVAAVLKVLALQVLLTAAVSVHTALLQKDMRFRRLFSIRLITVTLPGLVAIPLALEGMGYWALVAGTLAGQAIQVLILWNATAWRPALRFSIPVAKDLARFGSWVTMAALLSWFYIWADSLIVGMHLGAHELGLYRIANQFVMMIFGLLFAPLLPVLYSYMSSIQHDAERIRGLLFRVIRIITFVSVPTAFLLFGVADPLTSVMFGPSWSGLGTAVGVLALMHGFSWIVGANGEAYRALGRPELETKIMALTLAFYVVGYWISVQHGFEAFLWTRLGLALCAMTVHLSVARIVMDLSIARTLAYSARIAILCGPVLALAAYGTLASSGDIQRLVISLSAAALWILPCLWIVERRGLIPELTAMVRRN